MKKKRRVGRWVILIVVLLIALVVFLLLRQSSGSSSRYTEERLREGSIETYYSFSGNIDVRNSQKITATMNATVREVYVQEDEAIEAGTPLMRLSNGDIIKSDISGEVTALHVGAGDTITMGTPLADIIDFDDLVVLVKVDEFDVAAMTAGKEATVTVNALNLVFDSEVEHISKQAQPSGDINYYAAKLPAPQDERILPGMKVDVKVLNQKVDDALLLAMSALQFDDYNKPYVYMRNSAGDVTSVPVTTGIQDGTTVQITDGLRQGDVVLVPQSLFPFMSMGMR